MCVAITYPTHQSSEEDVLRNAGFPKQITYYNDNSPDFTRGYQFVIDVTSIMDIGTTGMFCQSLMHVGISVLEISVLICFYV